MADVTNYRRAIIQILEEYSRYTPAYGQVTMQTIFDTERDHYQLVTVGWDGHRRIYGTLVHIDILADSIWIQHDGTEGGIAHELVALGIPKPAIVLGFHAPYKRSYTDFGTGAPSAVEYAERS